MCRSALSLARQDELLGPVWHNTLDFCPKKASVQWVVSDIECWVLRSPFLLAFFCPPDSSSDTNPVFHLSPCYFKDSKCLSQRVISLLFQPMHPSHLRGGEPSHQRFPQWNWIQKLIWDSSRKPGGSWSWGGRDGGAAWLGLSTAGVCSHSMEALSAPSSFLVLAGTGQEFLWKDDNLDPHFLPSYSQ